MIFGIQAGKDIKLSEIARSLNEDIKLIKTENRLSRNLCGEGLDTHINQRLIEQSKDNIEKKRETPAGILYLDRIIFCV